jgi:hypothetical protein
MRISRFMDGMRRMPRLIPTTERQITTAITLRLAKEIDELQLDMIWDQFAKTTLQQENRMKPVLRDRFRRQKEDVLIRIQRNPLPDEERGIPEWTEDTTSHQVWRDVSDYISSRLYKAPSDVIDLWLLNLDEWNVVLEEAARPFVETSFTEGADEAISGINNDLDVTMSVGFDVRDPNIQTIVQDKLQKFSFEVNDTTNELLKKEFTEALVQGESIRKIESRVAKVFGFTSRVRTNRIARTEIIGAHNAGSFEAMVNSGIVATKRWINSRDAKVRDTHQTSEVVPLMERFSMGLRFPGDWTGSVGEIVNCRCAMRAETYLI